MTTITTGTRTSTKTWIMRAACGSVLALAVATGIGTWQIMQHGRADTTGRASQATIAPTAGALERVGVMSVPQIEDGSGRVPAGSRLATVSRGVNPEPVSDQEMYAQRWQAAAAVVVPAQRDAVSDQEMYNQWLAGQAP